MDLIGCHYCVLQVVLAITHRRRGFLLTAAGFNINGLIDCRMQKTVWCVQQLLVARVRMEKDFKLVLQVVLINGENGTQQTEVANPCWSIQRI